MERLIKTAVQLVDVPLGGWIRVMGGPVLERVVGGWKAVDAHGNPSGDSVDHTAVHLPAVVVQLDEQP